MIKKQQIISTVSNFHIDYRPVLSAKKSLRKTEKALQKSELFIM